MKLENGTFVFPAQDFADMNLLWSTSVEISWYSSLGLKNTDVSVKFYWIRIWEVRGVKQLRRDGEIQNTWGLL